MRTYTCKECGFSYGEADKYWDTLNSTKPCPKCAFNSTKLNSRQTKKIKISLVTITVILILFAVLTNDKSAKDNFILIAIIGLFMTIYILPFIEKKDMGGTSIVEYNEENLEVRLIFMIFAVVVSILCLYKLFI